MPSQESGQPTPERSRVRSVRAALSEVAGVPELRAYYAAFLGLFAVVALYERAVPLLAADVGISAAALGVGFGVARVAEIVASPVSGVVADARDRAAVAAVAAVALAGALALFPLVGAVGTLAPVPPAGSVVLLVALMAAVAVARPFLTNSATPAVSAAMPDDREGLGWAVRDVGLYAGSALGLAAGGLLVARFGVASVFPVAAPVALGVAAVAWRASDRGLPGLARPAAWRAVVERLRSAGGPLRAALDSAGSQPTRPDLPRPRVLARFCAVEAAVSLGGGMSLFLLPLLAVEVGLSEAAFLGLFAGASVAAAPLSVVGGAAADRLPRKGLYVGNYLAETLMLLSFGLAGGAATVLAADGPSFLAADVPALPAGGPVLFLVAEGPGGLIATVGPAGILAAGPALFLVGVALFVAQTAFEPAVLAYFFDQFHDDRAATAWSVEGTVSKAAGVVAPVAGGALFAADPGLPFLVGAGLMGVGTGVALTLPRGTVGS